MTRLASIEAMAGMDMLCSDKTGTLTLNKMVIQVANPPTEGRRAGAFAQHDLDAGTQTLPAPPVPTALPRSRGRRGG